MGISGELELGHVNQVSERGGKAEVSQQTWPQPSPHHQLRITFSDDEQNSLV
jgi:hypothetical protein